jgi:hypothetical protein
VLGAAQPLLGPAMTLLGPAMTLLGTAHGLLGAATELLGAAQELLGAAQAAAQSYVGKGGGRAWWQGGWDMNAAVDAVHRHGIRGQAAMHGLLSTALQGRQHILCTALCKAGAGSAIRIRMDINCNVYHVQFNTARPWLPPQHCIRALLQRTQPVGLS